MWRVPLLKFKLRIALVSKGSILVPFYHNPLVIKVTVVNHINFICFLMTNGHSYFLWATAAYSDTHAGITY